MKHRLLALTLGLVLALVSSTGPAMDACPFQSYLAYMPLVARHVVPSQGAGATYANCDRIASSGLTWYYDWSPNPPTCPSTRHRVAMIWGENQVGAQVSPDVEWVMGFNEPELTGQADILPARGAALWYEVEQDYPSKRLVSPAASLSWLTQWWDIYLAVYGVPPRVDAVASHCYGAWDAAAAISKCEAMADATVAWARDHGIGEVWVTEFAHLPCWSEGEVGSIEFMQAMVAYYRDTPEITRWAWFQNYYHGDEPWAFGPYCNTSLAEEDGTLTPLGEAYRPHLPQWFTTGEDY